MKVYIVFGWFSYEDFHIVGVFTALEIANQEYTKWYNSLSTRDKAWNDKNPNKYNVQEYELNKLYLQE